VSIRRLFINPVITLFFLGVLLISAGRLDYWQGWVYAAISLLMNGAIRVENGI
jgi:hypothetical protein